ncbi:hypothetical protein IFT84_13090 [Rhizobium sp. CFBP 8762]|uniref:hypothetical protein n=1 Tax=Rhizobium sp. CFBP 8762 TaxID=2775279 RepID=UPI00177C6384|nr:hypothetical protein [Rhizobium sp. CFBP 8762]MBD8555440.1 hypothetical protein [Rhizobium sp. CFBP 8762]
MTPDEVKAAARQELIRRGAKAELERRALASPQPEQGDGIALNATAGLNSGIYNTLGAPVDLARGAINLGIRGINAATGADLSTIPSDSFGGSESISGMFGAVGVPEPKDVTAATTGERVARGLGEGVGYTVAPEAAVSGLARSGAFNLAPRVGDAAGKLFGTGAGIGSTVANSVVGGASGASATAAMEAAPEPWKPVAGLAGGMGGSFVGALAASVPAAARGVGRLASDFAAPMTNAGRERLAGQQLADGATDLNLTKSILNEQPENLVAGSQPTTFQLTGDMGLGGLEREAQTRAPELFNQRRADQNMARVSAVEAVQPTGAPERVATSARQFMQSVTDRAETIYNTTLERAQERARGLGEGTNPSQTGDVMRQSIEDARKAAKFEEQRLWSAVDPDGTLALPASNARKYATETVRTMPKSAKPIEGEEAAMYQVLSQYGDVMPFSEIAALQSRVKAGMREERLANGESPAYRRLVQLNNAVENDIQAAVAGKIEFETQAVARGEMSYDDTLMANMQRDVSGWYGERQAVAGNTDSGTSSGGYGRTGSSAISGVRGATGKTARGSGLPAGNPGISEPSILPNFDAGAAGRLGEARDATLDIANRFDNKTLGPMRKRPSTVSPYDMASANVPGRVFYPGAKSADAITDYRAAVGDEAAMQQLQDYAVDRLRNTAMEPNGTLNPAKVESFRRSHADALRAFPELDRRFSDAAQVSRSLGEVAARQKAVVDDANRSRLGALMNLSDPQDVTRTIGGIFQRQDSVREMANVRRAVGNDPEAMKGLRKAVVDHITSRFVGNTEAATSGQAQIKSDQFQTFVKNNRPALSAAGFSPEEIGVMEAVAADLQRANRSISAVKIPGQSNTAQDTLKIQKGDRVGTVFSKILLAVGAGLGSAGGGMIGAAAGAMGSKAIGGMRETGIETVNDLVADALLNPQRAKVLLQKVPVRPDEGVASYLGGMYRHSVIPSAGVATAPREIGQEKRKPLEITVTPPKTSRTFLGGLAERTK